jgi:hypothetical protein
MMMNKRLIGTVKESKKYIAGNVFFQWVSLCANIVMMAAFCFARSSERVDRWFKGTKLYQENLKDFAAGKGMTARTKVRIMVTVTLLMTVALVAMGVKGIVAGCVVLGFVWAFHMVYFIWFVKTIPA